MIIPKTLNFTVEHVNRIRLTPGDVLLIRLPAGTDPEAMHACGQYAEKLLGRNRVLVTTSDVQVDVIDQAAATAISHQPDLPTGCSRSWGPHMFGPGRGILSDLRLHTCNLRDRHDGDCICKCSDRHREAAAPARKWDLP